MSTARQILPAAADGTPEWLAQRTQGIGGTDAAHLINGTRSRFRMWREKRGLAEPEHVSPELQALFDYGHSREPELARIFATRTGQKVRNTGTWVRKDQPWAIANPDRLVGRDGILEIKTTGAYTDAAKHWRDGGVPPHAWVQAHWYAYVTGRTRLWFIAEVDRVTYIAGPYDRDEDLITRMVETVTEFWSSVEDGLEPAPEREDAALAYPTSVEGQTVEAAPWTVDDVARLRDLKAQIAELEAEAKHLTEGIKLELGEAEALTADGRVLVTWRTQTRRGSVDAKALAAAAGLDVEDYRKPATTARTFLIKEA